MPIYISLLRGINVGAYKRIKMEHLRTSFEKLGFEQVKTYIQRGNVIFKTTKLPPQLLSDRIEKRLLTDFGFPISVVPPTVDEMTKVVEGNPFLNKRDINQDKFHIMFLTDAPTAA